MHGVKLRASFCVPCLILAAFWQGPVRAVQEDHQPPSVLGAQDVKAVVQEMKLEFQELKREGLGSTDLLLEVRLESGPVLLIVKAGSCSLTRVFLEHRASLERLNEWNRDQRFSRAYVLDQSQAIGLTYEIQIQPFVPRLTIEQFIRVFDRIVPKFRAFLEEKPGNGEEPPRADSPRGKATRAVPNLGITVELIPDDQQAGTFGAFLAGDPRPGSPGALARLAAGDTITRVNGKPLARLQDLQRLRGRVTIEFLDVRSRARHTVEVEVSGNDASDGGRSPKRPENPKVTARSLGFIGLRQTRVFPTPPPPYRGDPALQPVGPGTQAPVDGVLVTEVASNSPAARAGIRAGDVIHLTQDQDFVPDVATLEKRIAEAPRTLHLWLMNQGVYEDGKEAQLHW